jgi:hypothetical protein
MLGISPPGAAAGGSVHPFIDTRAGPAFRFRSGSKRRKARSSNTSALIIAANNRTGNTGIASHEKIASSTCVHIGWFPVKGLYCALHTVKQISPGKVAGGCQKN